MMSAVDLGFKLEYVKKLMIPIDFMKNWALYVVDLELKHMYILDPTLTEEDGGVDVMRAKHEQNARKILFVLIRCIHENLPDLKISSSNWVSCTLLQVMTGELMHSSEQSGVYILQYIQEFNGTFLRAVLSNAR